jgi:ketopantoate reductase
MPEQLMREVAAVAAARQIAVPAGAPDAVLAYARTQLDPGFKSSMLRDVEAGRPLEVEDLTEPWSGTGGRRAFPPR